MHKQQRGLNEAPLPSPPGTFAATIEKRRKELENEMNNEIDVDIINAELTRLVNEECRRQGVQEFGYKFDKGYQESADLRAFEIRGNGGKFSHYRPDNTIFRTANPYWNEYNSGENIQYFSKLDKYFNEKQIAYDLFIGWKNSEGHYNNMMNPSFTDHTIGLHLAVATQKEMNGYAFYLYYFNAVQILSVN